MTDSSAVRGRPLVALAGFVAIAFVPAILGGLATDPRFYAELDQRRLVPGVLRPA